MTLALWVLDAIIVGMALEGVALVALWRASRRGVAPADLLPNLVAGMCLLLAMRLGLGGAWLGWVGLALLGGLVGHVVDLWLRWVGGRAAG